MADRSAAHSAFMEAIDESGLGSAISGPLLARFRSCLLPRILVAKPTLLTSCRILCPTCGHQLHQPEVRRKQPHAKCWIFAEPQCFEITHVPKFCTECSVECEVKGSVVKRRVRYWCGFKEEPVANEQRAYTKVLDAAFCVRGLG